MNPQALHELGERIRGAYARVEFDEEQFPGIAAELLRDSDLSGFDFGEAGRFLVDPPVSQEPENKFSDLPLVAYRCREFYIQLLVWQESTTAIHEHAFSGAFRVVRGSSLHSGYSFQETRRISSRLLVGEVKARNFELLEVGGVREILPGRSGLIHALFHLEQPSVTCVVRTPALPWTQPQYAILKPHFAYAHHELAADDRVGIFRRFLRSLSETEPDTARELLLESAGRMELARLVAVLHTAGAILRDPADVDEFIEAVRPRHGELADLLGQALRYRQVEASLLTARRHTDDPDLRFFLALLLNVPDRPSILRLIGNRYPDRPAEETCADWILQLGQPTSLLDALARERARASAPQRGTSLVGQLAQALPSGVPEPLVSSWLRGVVSGADPAELPSRLAAEHPDADVRGESARLGQAHERLRCVGALTALLQ